MSEFGIAVIYKEKGYTSHDVVAVVKRTLKMKAGHTGTLDPNAEGVLPVCVGSATKLAGYLTAEDKTYLAKVRLGMTTDTGDDTGTVLSDRNVYMVDFKAESVLFNRDASADSLESDVIDRYYRPDAVITCEQIISVVSSFIGEQTQVPPMYSAVKVNGRKLYELARKGKTVEREPRRIVINSIKVLTFSPGEQSFIMEVSCSKGTYIRSLCEDIGEKLGCGACMGDLLRTRSGMFTLDKAVKLGDLTEKDLLDVEDVLPFPRALAHPDAEKRVVNGNPVPLDLVELEGTGEKYWLRYNDTLRGLYRKDTINLIPEVML